MPSAGRCNEYQTASNLRTCCPRTIWYNQGDDNMNRQSMLTLAAAGLIGLCVTGIAAAQRKISYKAPAENAKFTQHCSST